MTLIETGDKTKVPEESTDPEVKQQERVSADAVHYARGWDEGVIPQEKKELPWLKREKARLRETYERENREAGERIKARVAARDAAGKEEALFILRLNRENRVRPIKKYEEADALAIKEAEGLWRQEEVRPGFLSRFTNFFKDRTEKLVEFLSEPNREVERIRQIEIRSSRELRGVFKGAANRLRGSAGFLRGLGASVFGGISRVSGSIENSLKVKPNPPQKSGVEAPNPRSF